MKVNKLKKKNILNFKSEFHKNFELPNNSILEIKVNKPVTIESDNDKKKVKIWYLLYLITIFFLLYSCLFLFLYDIFIPHSTLSILSSQLKNLSDIQYNNFIESGGIQNVDKDIGTLINIFNYIA